MTPRAFTFSVLFGDLHTSRLGRHVDLFLVVLIVVNVVAVILETVDSMAARHAELFFWIEIISVAVFTIEYFVRLWCCVEEHPEDKHIKSRFIYAISPLAVIDLLAIAPFFLAAIFGADLRFLRAFRLLRVFKLTRYSSAMGMLVNVFKQEAGTLFAGFFILIILLVMAASGAYLFERDAQPDKFGSIPLAMWWATVTLTTVGYGDVVPITTWGKVFGACVTIIGIGMAALPAGILASGLADEMRRKREVQIEAFRSRLMNADFQLDNKRQVENLRRVIGLSKPIAHEVLREVVLEDVQSDLKYCPHCGEKL